MKTDVKEVKLQVWEEIIDNCVKFETKKDQVVVILKVCGQKVRMAYTRNSQEGIILRRFGRKPVGQKNRDSSNGHPRETNYCKNHDKEEFDKLTEEKTQTFRSESH
jgi:ABC-type enterochelin transport system substrate-binding protein